MWSRSPRDRVTGDSADMAWASPAYACRHARALAPAAVPSESGGLSRAWESNGPRTGGSGGRYERGQPSVHGLRRKASTKVGSSPRSALGMTQRKRGVRLEPKALGSRQRSRLRAKCSREVGPAAMTIAATGTFADSAVSSPGHRCAGWPGGEEGYPASGGPVDRSPPRVPPTSHRSGLC